MVCSESLLFGWLAVTCYLLVPIDSLNPNLPNNPNDNDKPFMISSIEDVEMLTYFLLWRHDYFDKPLQSNKIYGERFIDYDPEQLSETRLREFIEKLKINNLIKNQPTKLNLSKTCDDNTFRHLSTKTWWPSQSTNETMQICEAANSCKNAKQLVNLLGLNAERSPTLSQSIARLCPLMLFQLQEKECVEQRENTFKAKNKPTAGSVWGFGLLFVTIVSFCSLIGVGVLPFLSKSSFEILLSVLQGLGVGSLVGSAIFHLIPQAFNLVTPGNHEYLGRAFIIFSGIYLFFWSERIMKMISEVRRKKKLKEHSIPSSTSVDNDTAKCRQVYFQNSEQANLNNKNEMALNESNHLESNGKDNELEMMPKRDRANSNFLMLKHEHSHSHGESNEIATIAWMIIFGDGLHNFIDGITIGAAFTQSILQGISISVAVICEEFPHELGDFAILLGSGMSMRKALGYNFLSACTCYLGLIFGILLGDLSDATPYVFALAGGMFLYISLVDMMGELSNKLEIAGKRGLTHTAQVFILQNIGILIGVSIMFFLAKYSDKINFEGLVPPQNSDMPFTET